MTLLPSVACALVILRVAFTAAGSMSRRRVQQAASRDTCPADQDLRPILDNALRLPLPQLLNRMLKQSSGQADSYPLQLVVLDDDADDTIVLQDGSSWKPYREVDEVKAAGEYVGGLPAVKALSPEADDNSAIDTARAPVLPVLEKDLQEDVFEVEDAIDRAGVDAGARELGDFETDRKSVPQNPQQVPTTPVTDAAIQSRPDLARVLRDMGPETAEGCEQKPSRALLPDLPQDVTKPGSAQLLPETQRTPQNEGNDCGRQESQAETALMASQLGSTSWGGADLPGPLQKDASSEFQVSKVSSDVDDVEESSSLVVNRACSPEAGVIVIADSQSKLEDGTGGTSHVEQKHGHRKPLAETKLPMHFSRASTSSAQSGASALRARLAAAVSQLSQTEPSQSLVSAGTQTAANGSAAPWYLFHGDRQKQAAAALSAFFVLLYFYMCYALVAWAKEFYEVDIREDLDFL
ncbi:unnamed protein product [Ixodes hexagonus]